MGDGVGGGGNNSGSGLGGGGGGGGPGGGGVNPDYEEITVTAPQPDYNGGGGYTGWDQYGYNSDWWFDQHYGEMIGDPDITAPEYDYSDYDNNDTDDDDGNNDDGKPDGGVSIGGSNGIVDISVNEDGKLTIGVSKGWVVGATFDLTTGQIEAVEVGLGHKIGGIGASATISYSDGKFYLNVSAGMDGSYDSGMGMTLSVQLDFSRDFYNGYYQGAPFQIYLPPY